MTLPKDPVILLSFVNTKLRDFNSSLDDFCKENNLNEDEIKRKLEMIDYHYDEYKWVAGNVNVEAFPVYKRF